LALLSLVWRFGVNSHLTGRILLKGRVFCP
jgi:hypothetical protein